MSRELNGQTQLNTENPRVGSSILPLATTFSSYLIRPGFLTYRADLMTRYRVRVSGRTREMLADIGENFAGFEGLGCIAHTNEKALFIVTVEKNRRGRRQAFHHQRNDCSESN